MFKRMVFCVVLLFVVAGANAAEVPAMQWHKGHGTDKGDHVHYGMQTSDGGYIMAGHCVGLMRATTDESSPDIPSSFNRMFNLFVIL
jgi:hypothetical protein